MTLFDPHRQTPEGVVPDLFHGPLAATLLEAGRKALFLQERVQPECKKDGTLVTPADQELEDILRKQLLESDPGCRVVGEEAVALGRGIGEGLAKGRAWIIDPIDGTALYAFRMSGWGISLGLMEDGVLTDGLVLFPSPLPGTTSLLLGGSGKGVIRVFVDLSIKSDGSIAVDTPVMLGETVPPVPGFPGLLGISQTLAKNALYDGPHTILNTASCVSSFLHLMNGSLTGYCARVKLWDLAAVWPLAWRLGIRACDYRGIPMGTGLDQDLWHVDPASPSWLAQKSHILYSRPGQLDTERFWKDLSWREGKIY